MILSENDIFLSLPSMARSLSSTSVKMSSQSILYSSISISISILIIVVFFWLFFKFFVPFIVFSVLVMISTCFRESLILQPSNNEIFHFIFLFVYIIELLIIVFKKLQIKELHTIITNSSFILQFFHKRKPFKQDFVIGKFIHNK